MTEERTRIRPEGGNGITTHERSVAGRSETGAPVMHQVEEVRERALPDGFDLKRDRVHWGPIVAGLLTGLTALLLLSLLGLAIGLTTVNAGTAAAQGGPPADAGRNSAIWAAIAGVLSFLLGGYVAGRTAALFNRGWGALNGALVFMLAVPLILWLAQRLNIGCSTRSPGLIPSFDAVPAFSSSTARTGPGEGIRASQ